MKISDNNINARGLSKEELQAAIDFTVRSKNKSIQDLLEDQKEAFLQLTELVPDFAEKMLEVIKEKHPELLKEI
jgi:hypothetical protein